ncbi:MAG: PaaI family thioesterase [Nevskia sp.]|nr:PaaI family thioesterase [Nevskia sp.]
MELKMTAQQVTDLIHLGFDAKRPMLSVEEVRPNFVRTRLLYRDSMLRPGKVLSGPAMFTAADLAMYALVLSHVGPQLMAVTANLNINFLNKAAPGDIIADGKLLKLGRRLAVMEAALFSSAAPELCIAHVTGSYALPIGS